MFNMNSIGKKIAQLRKAKGLIAPFISHNVISTCAKKSYTDKGITSIISMCPFIDQNVLNELALDAAYSKGVNEILPIIPFIDEKLIDKLLNEKSK